MIRTGPCLVVLALVAWGCEQSASRPAGPAAEDRGPRVREPAVASFFYPADPELLRRTVDGLLAEAKPVPMGRLRGLVCPHAGYEFSGPTAAWGYRQLVGRPVRTVVVLGTSHYAYFQGASVPDADEYATPLGRIPLSPRARELAQRSPFGSHLACQVNRPNWWRDAPKEAPPFGEDTPHTWEHSVEVQLPFLQRALDGFQLVPAVLGEVDPEKAAAALEEILDDQTVVIASSDLSHYYPYDVANQLDASCVRAICDLDVQWMENEQACGKRPILTLMHLARKKGWKTCLLDQRNSGDTSGRRYEVVGYAAVAFYEGEDPPGAKAPGPLNAREQALALDLARRSITRAVRDRSALEVDADELPERLRVRQGCFVTLTKEGQLRGCIGHIFASMPLYRSVIENAANAAVDDPRFQPVTGDELDEIHIEVSVLTTPKRVAFGSPEELLERLRPGVDGVVFGLRGRRATYLPQVWEQMPDKERFLSQLAQKAGLGPEAWKDPDAGFLTYQVQAFEEEEDGSP